MGLLNAIPHLTAADPARPGPYAVQTLTYGNRVNHGQFNTTWGRANMDGFSAAGLLNLAPIMPQAEQQQVAKVLISAFLETVLFDPDALASIRFVFDRSERGAVVLDEIGFRR